MKDNVEGVRGYKQISLKKFSKAISHNLKLLALSRDLNLYELQNQIVAEFISDMNKLDQLVTPALADKSHYNVFLGIEVHKLTSALSEQLKVPESEIVYSALVSYADRLALSEPLIAPHTD
ncbi:hypothetical protein EXT65_21245 [Pectobacterium carotovorum subsp. carotovorum]|nr:hypothetical protein [Pectobacterium carotovorum]MCL6336321.1 hypothetical protein [Pectobacterium carotovorum subsp. carotovorum]